MRNRSNTARFYLTTLGVICLLGGVVSLSSGDRSQATIGFILGVALIVGNEWWQWRKRH